MTTSFRRLWRKVARTWVGSAALTILAVLSFRSAVADWHDVPTGSMQPTIMVGDRIVVNRLAYDLHVPLTRKILASWADPRCGDVVTCWSPHDGVRLVKRVIGVPGDVVAMQDGRLILNGEPVGYQPLTGEAPHRAMGAAAAGVGFWREDLPGRPHEVGLAAGRANRRDFGPVVVPPDRYLVLGDDRDRSADSRVFGFVPRADITGRVTGVAFSLDRGHSWLPRGDRWGRRII